MDASQNVRCGEREKRREEEKQGKSVREEIKESHCIFGKGLIPVFFVVFKVLKADSLTKEGVNGGMK